MIRAAKPVGAVPYQPDLSRAPSREAPARGRKSDGTPSVPATSPRRGITLTEILISIMILGVGMVALASLFPIGLLRLRDANRYTRSTYLTESAQCDATARSLFSQSSFQQMNFINTNNPLMSVPWYPSALTGALGYNPLTNDTAFYGDDPFDPNNPGATTAYTGGAGLPFAYDPLWRYQATFLNNSPALVQLQPNLTGVYLDPGNVLGLNIPEARFGSGIGFLRPEGYGDPTGQNLPSAFGLQRLTNFTYPALFPASYTVPNIFVSPEDTVWNENVASNAVSPVLPDFSYNAAGQASQTPTQDWRYTWMFTGSMVSGTGGSSFTGYVVVFENRPFGIDLVNNVYQPTGETVVEAIFGHGANIQTFAGAPGGYAAGADKCVLLRWSINQADPTVRVGDWIADVTYERRQLVAYNPNGASRFMNGAPPSGIPNPINNLEWDNMPPQRCIWYQVQKVISATDDYYLGPGYRSMVVYVDRTLSSRTVLTAAGIPLYQNAAFICPNVANVIPQQFTVR
jgi:hypothetical protein